MRKFVGLRAKTYSYLVDDARKDKNAKDKDLVCAKEGIEYRI